MPRADGPSRAPSLAAIPRQSLTEKVDAMTEDQKMSSSIVRCEHDRLLAWLREVLAGSDGVDVHIVVEEDADARSSVRITLHDVPGPLASLQLRPLA